jgi:hypothetical protein
VLGFAFKKDTNDTRESAAITVCRYLIQERAQVVIYDPKVASETIWMDLQLATGLDRLELERYVTVEHDVYRALQDAHAFVVLTEWDEFTVLDFERIFNQMKKPAFAFDGRNILPATQLRALGFKVAAIGKPHRRSISDMEVLADEPVFSTEPEIARKLRRLHSEPGSDVHVRTAHRRDAWASSRNASMTERG